MATTGTYTYNPTGTILINDALRALGVLEEGVSATTAQITDSLPAFEMYIKSLTKYGLNLWTTATHQETVVSGTYSFSPTNKYSKITDMVYRNSSGNDLVMHPLTREEYWSINDKDQSGEPNQYYYDPQETAALSTIYVWPAPDATAATATSYFEVVGQILFEDVSSSTTTAAETIGIPQEWLETIKYGLATRLAPMYGYPVQERNLLLREYNQMLKENLDWDTEQESIFLQPATS